MEFILLIAVIVVIVLLITNRNDNSARLERLEYQLSELKNLLKQRPPVQEEQKSIVKELRPAALKEQVEKPQEIIKEKLASVNTFIPPNYLAPYQQEPKPSFFERYPDLEKFIGENLVNKIGIGILVLAIGFFVKYAIDNNWIGPVGRVGIGVLSGGILIAIAHRLRNSYKAFSSVLVGGGVAVLYFTITLAYHQFHLFGQTTSFIIMIAITILAVVLALWYDRQELAVIALAGGLSSPFMLSSGHANYIALLSYIVILNAGLLIIGYKKTWRILNISTFGLTVIVFSIVTYTLTDPTYETGLIYATVLYLMFFSINVANNVRENKVFIAADFSLLLINTALYFGLGLYLLTQMHEEQFRGLFCAGIGCINLVLSYVMFRNRKVDINILYLLIGITLTFISLTAPIQLHGHNITLFWSAEAVLLYWLYQKSGIRLMQLTSMLIWIIMLISLTMDWAEIYNSSADVLTIIANKGFITTLVSAIGFYLLYVLMRKVEGEDIYGFKVQAVYFEYVAFVLLFAAGLFEVNHQFLSRYYDTSLNSFYNSLYLAAFVYIFCRTYKSVTDTAGQWVRLGLYVIAIGAYLLFVQYYFDAQYIILVQHSVSSLHFIAHWFSVAFIALMFYEIAMLLKDTTKAAVADFQVWIYAAAAVTFLSLEFSFAANEVFYRAGADMYHIQTVYNKVGLPILWGASSFALMWLGMRHKARTLRIISLTLFTLTLLKLFIFDIRNIPPAGKIAAFFCLGVLLLIVSFMYQKVKKIIVDDTGGKNE